jgi:hypothetical protein
MTTDKVRVEIRPKTVHPLAGGIIALASVFYEDEEIQWIQQHNKIATRHAVWPDKDNWIDITLPEEIDGEKRFSVQIWHDGLTWKAVMKNRYDKFRDMMVKGIIPTIYELPVTVY